MILKKAASAAFIYIHSFFCLPNKRKNQRKIHLRCFSISSEIAKKLGASKTSFAVQSKVSALFPIFYQILREKQRGHFFLSWRIFKTARGGCTTGASPQIARRCYLPLKQQRKEEMTAHGGFPVKRKNIIKAARRAAFLFIEENVIILLFRFLLLLLH